MYTSCDWIVGQSQSPVNDLVIVNFLIKHELCSGAVAEGGGRGSYAPPIVETRRKIVNVVGNCRKIVNVVGNCQRCRPGGFKMWSSDLVCRKIFSVCRKSTALGPPKNMGPTAPLELRVFQMA